MPVLRGLRSATVAFVLGLSSSLAALPANARGPLDAVVGVHAIVPQNARTAGSLGTERAGSGVVIEPGIVLTVGYLILEASRVDLALTDGHSIPANPLAYDHQTGFGLIEALAPLVAEPVMLGDSSTLEIGQDVLAASYGGRGALVPASVVDRREFAGYWEYLLEDAIFTAPPHPFFGGAALFGPRGELLGIGSLIVSDAGGKNQVLPGNMFIPIDSLKPILADMKRHGTAQRAARPWLGVYTREIGGELVVERVARRGPAERAGLAPEDRLLAVAGQAVSNLADFYRKVWSQGGPGSTVRLTVRRGGAAPRDLEIVAGDRADYYRLDPSL